MQPNTRTARIAGVYYLIVAITGAFAAIARNAVTVPGNAALTAQRLAANETVIRLAIVADLTQCVFFLLVALTLYRLLRSAGKSAARLMLAAVIVAVAVTCLNLVGEFGALVVATDSSYATAFGARPAAALVLLLMTMQHYGVLCAQVFFGLWLLPLGRLVYRSRRLPRALGVLLAIACFCYLVEALAEFVAPAAAPTIAPIVLVPATVAELWMVGYLLIIGIRREGGDYSSSASSLGSSSSLAESSSTLTSLNVSTRTDLTKRSER